MSPMCPCLNSVYDEITPIPQFRAAMSSHEDEVWADPRSMIYYTDELPPFPQVGAARSSHADEVWADPGGVLSWVRCLPEDAHQAGGGSRQAHQTHQPHQVNRIQCEFCFF